MAERMPSHCFFVIIFEARNGSSYTVSALNSHKNILCYPEILAGLDEDRQNKILDSLFSGAAIEEINPYAAHPRYFHGNLSEKQDLKNVGFKVNLCDVANIVDFQDSLLKNNVSLIYLRRENIVKSVVSLRNAVKLFNSTGHYNAESPSEIICDSFEYLAENFANDISDRMFSEWVHMHFYLRYANKKMTTSYEEFVGDRGAFFNNMCSFIGIDDPGELEGSFFKATPDKLAEAVSNYDEVIRDFEKDGFWVKKYIASLYK